jgi:hypothetical protein
MHQSQSISVIGLRIVDPEEALGTGIHQNQIDLLGNLLIGLFPRDGFKSIPYPLERTLQAMGIVQIMKISMAFRAHHSQVAIGIGIPFNLPKPSILNGSKYATTIPASVAKRRDPGDRGLCACMSPALEVEKVLTQGKGPYGCSRYFEKPPSR